MSAQSNSIAIDGNGNITLQEINNSSVTINTNNPQEIIEKLKQLNKGQIDTLLQIADVQREKLSDLFQTLLKGIASEKNVVKGDISNVGAFTIGDNNEINYHYHYYTSETKLPKELTLNIPKIHPDDIIGREDDLKELHDLLNNDKRVVVVNGMGGIGKTTLVQVYVTKYYEEYEHIVWITQNSESIVTDFINETGLIKNLSVNITDLEPDQIFEEIIRKLKGIEDRPNLLIIDNGEQSLSKNRHLLPNQPKWHVLVTSREEITGFYVKPIGFLSELQAVELFKEHYPSYQLDDQDIRELVITVDYHTLTIEILAKTAKVQRYNAATLKGAIENDLRANVEVSHKREYGKIERIGSYLSSVFNLSKLNKKELWLLKQFACLPSNFHTYDLLHELLIDEESLYRDIFSEILSGLSQKGWLLQNTATDSYKMHRIIADVFTKDKPINPTDVQSLISAITQNLCFDQNKGNPVENFIWLPYGNALLPHIREDESPKTSLFQHILAQMLQHVGDSERAKTLLEKVILINEKIFGKDHHLTIRAYGDLGSVLQELNDYKGAKSLIKKAVFLNEKNFGKDHSYTATSYSFFGNFLREVGDYRRAKLWTEKAVESDVKNFGKDHPSTAIGYSNLALILIELGEYLEAKNLFEKAAESIENKFGGDHPFTTRIYSNLANVLWELGNYNRAKALWEKAVTSNRKYYGQDHPSTMNSYSNLAVTLQDLGNNKRAKELLVVVVEFTEKHFGKDNISTAKSYTNLASALINLGEYDRAKELLDKALISVEKNLGNDHPFKAICLSHLATVFKKSKYKNYKRAKELLEQVIISDEKNFGVAHRITGRSYSSLAVTLFEEGDSLKALELAEKAVSIYRKTLPKGHPEIEYQVEFISIIKQGLERK